MLHQPLLHNLQQGRLDERRDGDPDLVLAGRRLLGGGLPWVLGGGAGGAEDWPARSGPC